MNQTAIAFVVGLLGGAVGALGSIYIANPEARTAGDEGSKDMSEIAERLDRIETALGRRPGEPMLRGSASPGGSAKLPEDASELDAVVAALEERLRPAIEESVSTSVARAVAERGAEFKGKEEPEPEKKKTTLAQAAMDLELSADEEESVRRIAQETTDEFLRLLAGEDQTVDDIRREFDDAKEDPVKRIGLTAKYIGKVMGNMGGLIALGFTHDKKMKEAIGPEKARRLEDEYELTDLDPLGLEAAFGFDK